MKLLEIGETGTLSEQVLFDDFLREVVEATVAHYQRIGFVPPWIGYVGLNDGVPVGVCERMEYIVGTACALQQRDHDVEGTRQCVAQELKYTMWSAYGCR